MTTIVLNRNPILDRSTAVRTYADIVMPVLLLVAAYRLGEYRDGGNANP